MSFSEALVQGTNFGAALQGLAVAVVLLVFLMMFRPLLKGIGRAFALAVRQQITARKELAQRRSLHEARVLAARS
jgi:hypothetical protein